MAPDVSSPSQSKKERKLAKKAKRKLLLTKREEPSHNIIDIVGIDLFLCGHHCGVGSIVLLFLLVVVSSVLEGLGLAPPGKSAIDPYCVVRVGSAVYVTSVKRGVVSCTCHSQPHTHTHTRTGKQAANTSH